MLLPTERAPAPVTLDSACIQDRGLAVGGVIGGGVEAAELDCWAEEAGRFLPAEYALLEAVALAKEDWSVEDDCVAVE